MNDLKALAHKFDPALLVSIITIIGAILSVYIALNNNIITLQYDIKQIQVKQSDSVIWQNKIDEFYAQQKVFNALIKQEIKNRKGAEIFNE